MQPPHPAWCAPAEWRQARSASATPHDTRPSPRTARTSARRGKTEDPMNRSRNRVVASFGTIVLSVALLSLVAAIPARAQSQVLLQGTQVHLRLLTGLSTANAKNGDPFVAEVTQPIYVGNEMILPAGAHVNGTVGDVVHTRHFSIFRGQAAMNLSFRELEIDSRLIPAKMSILALENPPTGDQTGKERKDVKVDEGQVIEAKHDYKGDIIGGAIGIGGGTVVGAIFSHVTRGFAFGLAGSAAYILSRKGKEVELPVQTTLMVRMDNSISLPKIVAENEVP